MTRYKKDDSAKARNHKKCNGWKNWDTWTCGAVMGNDRRTYDYVVKNKQKLLRMKKEDKLRAINRNSDVGLGNISFRNVSAKELDEQIRDM